MIAASPPITKEGIVERIAAHLQDLWPRRPRVAIVLGTGMGNLASHIRGATIVPYDALPGFPCSTAVGHRGVFVGGTLNGIDVLAMDGRLHLYEGYSVDRTTLGIRVAAQLGAEVLIVTNASGGLNPQFRPADVMLVVEHLNLMGARTASLAEFTPCPSRSSPVPLYDPQLIEIAEDSARRNGFACHRGVYVSVLGPNYETRAEYRFMRRIGGDAVGMSTVPEVLVAAQCGLRVLALSTITNIARPDAPSRVDCHEVIDIASQAEPRLRSIVCDVVGAVGEEQ